MFLDIGFPKAEAEVPLAKARRSVNQTLKARRMIACGISLWFAHSGLDIAQASNTIFLAPDVLRKILAGRVKGLLIDELIGAASNTGLQINVKISSLD